MLTKQVKTLTKIKIIPRVFANTNKNSYCFIYNIQKFVVTKNSVVGLSINIHAYINTVEPLRSGPSRPTSVRMLEFVRNSEYLVYNLHDRLIRVNSCILQGRRLVRDILIGHI